MVHLVYLECLVTPEYFAHQIAYDIDVPIAAQFIPLIADAIRKQVEEYAYAVENDPITNEPIEDPDEEPGYGDVRIVIKVVFLM